MSTNPARRTLFLGGPGNGYVTSPFAYRTCNDIVRGAPLHPGADRQRAPFTVPPVEPGRQLIPGGRRDPLFDGDRSAHTRLPPCGARQAIRLSLVRELHTPDAWPCPGARGREGHPHPRPMWPPSPPAGPQLSLTAGAGDVDANLAVDRRPHAQSCPARRLQRPRPSLDHRGIHPDVLVVVGPVVHADAPHGRELPQAACGPRSRESGVSRAPGFRPAASATSA